MAYDTPFQSLTPDEERYLSNVNHQSDRTIYIDCLAFLHDLLADFGTASLHSAFEPDQIKRAASEAKANFARSAYSLKNNIETNMRTALDLHQELTSGARQVTRPVTLSYVEEYLNDLLDQYRVIRRATIP